ncbi:peptidoglycan recognition protein family protein [Streptomyces ossamyceticus]|uniref:peptidoglycan recognition protein family protein n=1 Tax=Streptomyces ossamyceticus TaxID=249581 RepID=UPI0006E1E97F|nr:peptidoglycan recognition family protein [Streptomyces ossamyceticus]
MRHSDSTGSRSGRQGAFPAFPASPLPRRVLLTALGAAASAVVIGPSPAAAAPAAPYTLLTRRDWGADETLRFAADGRELWPPEYHPVQTLTVHHTADGSTDPDPAARVRAIYREEAVGADDYGDIGYNYLIDENGRVYEGRWSGTDGTPAHDAGGRLVTGAHVQGYNSGNVGIALLGTLTDRPASAAARATLVRLLAELAERHRIDPLGKVAYRNPVSGVSRVAPAIGGHRHWANTDCPGSLYTAMPSLREEVAALMAG